MSSHYRSPSSGGRGLYKVLGVATSIVALHSATVIHRNYSRKEEVKIQQERKRQIMLLATNADFRAGSTEDLVMDSVKTGDVLVFSRRWYFHHLLPMGITLWLYRQVFDCDFDHIGVVLVDTFGKPYLLENTPYKGLQCRSLSERLLHATSSENIVLMPIMPRERVISHERQIENQKLLKAAIALTEGETKSADDLEDSKQILKEIVDGNEMQSLIVSVLKKVFNSYSSSGKDKKGYIDCNANFLVKTHAAVGITTSPSKVQKKVKLVDRDGFEIDDNRKPEDDGKELTMNKIVNRQVDMISSDSVVGNKSMPQLLTFDPESVLVRTS